MLIFGSFLSNRLRWWSFALAAVGSDVVGNELGESSPDQI
jgi:hypothetical protein